MALGRFGSDLTLDQARALARKRLAEVAEGGDPLADRQKGRKSPTMSDFCDTWLKHAGTYKKPSSLANDELYISRYIKPALGKLKAASLTKGDVEALHKKVGKDSPVMANRVLAVVSAALTYAEGEGVRPQNSNVCKLIRRFPEKERHRALSEIELRRLIKVLDEWPTKPHKVVLHEDGKPKKHARKQPMPPTTEQTTARRLACDAVRLILLTGCRRSEIAHLKWSEVDTERRVLRLADSKSGPRLVYLNTPAIEVIERQERAPLNPYVFASPTKQGAPISDLKRAWRTIRGLANLDDLRMHDLRHHAGEGLATLGFNEAFISKLLGHKDHSVTRRYIDVAMSPLHEAAERYGETVAGIVGGDQQIEVVEGEVE